MISVVCPFYNEKENLQELLTRLHKTMTQLQDSWEVLFVDDGSSDAGDSIVRNYLKSSPNFRMIELDRNYGLSAALYAGFQEAKGEVLVTLDSDLQNPPEEIPRLVRELRDCDIVAGVRQNRSDTWLKRISSLIANRIRRQVTGDHLSDVGCTLRVFKRETLEVFFPYKGMHRFFMTLAEAEGFKIKEISVEHERRKYGTAKYGLRNRLLGPLWDLLAFHWMLTHRIRYRLRSAARV